MRTRSHPVALMIAMIVGFSLTAVSCSPEATTPGRISDDGGRSGVQTAQSLHDQYAWTGKYHNDALAYAAKKISESKQLSKFAKCQVGLAALKDFQKAFRKSGGNAVFGDLTITDGMCEAANSLSNRVAAARSVAPVSNGPRQDISVFANDYMNQISYQVDVASSVEDLASAVAGIENQAAGSVSALEAAAVVSSGSIAVSSAGYWTSAEGTATLDEPAPYARTSNVVIENLGDLTPRAVIGISPRTKRIIKADVIAAVSILLKEWFTGEAAIAKACITAAAASLIAGLYAT